MKNAIYIKSGWGQPDKLFAVCPQGEETTRHYNLAKESIEKGSSDWVSVRFWTDPYQFNPIMWSVMDTIDTSWADW